MCGWREVRTDLDFDLCSLVQVEEPGVIQGRHIPLRAAPGKKPTTRYIEDKSAARNCRGTSKFGQHQTS